MMTVGAWGAIEVPALCTVVLRNVEVLPNPERVCRLNLPGIHFQKSHDHVGSSGTSMALGLTIDGVVDSEVLFCSLHSRCSLSTADIRGCENRRCDAIGVAPALRVVSSAKRGLLTLSYLVLHQQNSMECQNYSQSTKKDILIS